MKEQSTNELIPQLIEKFSSHANKLRDRVKINSFFAEFNQTARNQLNQFIKMSQNRYKGVKSGNSLENILFHQKPEYTKISNQILSDQFYSTNDIEVENKKLFKKTKKKDNDEINELRNKIKTGAKDFSKAEILKRENLLAKVEKKRLQQKQRQEAMKISRLTFNYKPLAEKNLVTTKTINDDEESNDYEQDLETLTNEKQKFVKTIEDLVTEDEQNFHKNANEYQQYLKDITEAFQRGENIKTNINKYNSERSFNFLTDNIKLLSYKEDTVEKVKPKKKEDTKIDIYKLLRYTKRGKSAKWFKDKSRAPSSYTNFDTTHTTSFGKTMSDFRNTIKTVRSEAEKVIRLDENFDLKRETMNNGFKQFELPKLEEYESRLISKTGNSFYKGNKTPNQIGGGLDNKKNKDKGTYYCGRRNIMSAFNRTYLRKRDQWKMEDSEVEKQKLQDIENKREINEFLRKIKNTSKQKHEFVDGYSQREKVMNMEHIKRKKTTNVFA